MTRKTCMAAALALATTGAHAQTEVRVYGLASAVLESVRSTSVPRKTRFVSNSSLLGFEGAEDLGNGYKASFQIEGGLDIDNGSGRVNNRDSYVALQGGFGRIKAGFMTSPMRGMGSRMNFVPGSTSIANNIGIMTTLNGQATGLNSRMQNSIRYDTPNMNGLAGALIWAPGENRAAGQNNYAYGAGLSYVNGPLYAGYAYESRNAQRILALGESEEFGHRIAARYTLGTTTVGIALDRMKSRGDFFTDAGPVPGSIARSAWSVSAKHTAGIHDFIIHYAGAGDVRCAGAAAEGQCASSSRPFTGARQLSLLYQYILSKRTMWQAYFSRINNEAAARYDFDGDPVISGLAARIPGSDTRGFGFGIRHEF
ncbi:porin [Noviherbaspirillum sp. CPCC 100848]|uniref:Porin n=1 Tax=Noviherbaspirillum album TaxID=3080276 RepID=A0ABU6J2P9_9BURK|nr:porin [Noviherbaspirillum sp. CPCC 100848]MEC4717582.1 porin [Noviherbaspirillum sp. CPCC 100848]